MNRTVKLIGYIILGLIFPFWIILARSNEKKSENDNKSAIQLVLPDSIGKLIPSNINSQLTSLLDRLVNADEENKRQMQSLPVTFATILKDNIPNNINISVPNIRLDTIFRNPVSNPDSSIGKKPLGYKIPYVLWISDNFTDTTKVGDSNRRALTVLIQNGVLVDTVTSISEAVNNLQNNDRYLGIISDMYRQSEPLFGLRLLDTLNAVRLQLPVFYYSFTDSNSILAILNLNGLEMSSDQRRLLRFIDNLKARMY